METMSYRTYLEFGEGIFQNGISLMQTSNRGVGQAHNLNGFNDLRASLTVNDGGPYSGANRAGYATGVAAGHPSNMELRFSDFGTSN